MCDRARALLHGKSAKNLIATVDVIKRDTSALNRGFSGLPLWRRSKKKTRYLDRLARDTRRGRNRIARIWILQGCRKSLINSAAPLKMDSPRAVRCDVMAIGGFIPDVISAAGRHRRRALIGRAVKSLRSLWQYLYPSRSLSLSLHLSFSLSALSCPFRISPSLSPSPSLALDRR